VNRLLVLVTMSLLHGIAEAGACEESFTALQFEDQLGAAETALADVNLAQFRSNLDRADAMIPCLDERLLPPLVATYHRFFGIRAYGDRDPMARSAFAAARYLEPGYSFSRALIPDGNPVREAFEGVDYENRTFDLLEAAGRGVIYLDGSRSLRRPREWPTLMQWVEGDEVRLSRYVLPGESVPEYPLISQVPSTRREPLIPLVVVSGVAAAASAALYGVALSNQARYKRLDDPVPDERLPGLRRETNGLVVASGVTAMAAVGTGVAVVATW